jgi:hypothetical protein
LTNDGVIEYVLRLCLQVPSGKVLVDVPRGMSPGQTFVLDLQQAPKQLAAGARQQALVQQLPKARKVTIFFFLIFFSDQVNNRGSSS